MTTITNLTRFRKQKARDDARAKGDANAAKFGRTKAQKSAEDTAASRASAHLDQHRLDEGRRDD